MHDLQTRQVIGAKMRAAMVTQEDIGKRLRCTGRQVRNLLSRPGRMRLEDLNAIADKLSMTDREWIEMTRWR